MKKLDRDLKESRKHEMKVYLESMQTMYENALAQNGDIYDIASALTSAFRDIQGKHILEDSRIIKILRYAVVPSISQMKFGQFFGIKSISRFENEKLESGSKKHKELRKIAAGMAAFVSEHLDHGRFRWVAKEHSLSDMSLASDYAKGWTCSIAADQNAQTRYRNWRKDIQEHAIASMLIKRGYTKSSFAGIIRQHSDINIGEYVRERRVQGRTIQKADLIVRSKKSKRLVLIEAKAVGVEIDSTKRIKECCDKASDWCSSSDLKNPIIVAVIAGFFNEIGITNMIASNIEAIWEHRLSDLRKVL